MSVIDQIRKRVLIDATETVNADWSTRSQTLDDRTGPFSLFIKYENGSSVDMVIKVQLSVNGTDWADIEETLVPILDNEGSIIYDIDGSGTEFVRIAIIVNSGSIDVVEARFVGSQWH
jgi:hypothetical protein